MHLDMIVGGVKNLFNPAICICRFSNKTPNLSSWWLDCSCWVLVICSSGGMGEAVLVCIGVAEPWPDGVAWGKNSLLGALKEWLLLAWKDIMDNGQRCGSILPSVGGRTPSRTMIFTRRLQKGIHVQATIRATVFLVVWKMWAQISIGTLVMRPHRNYALPRLMNAVFKSG